MFLAAAFLPYSRVFVESDPAKRMAIIRGAMFQWNLAHILFPLGALLTAAGLALMVHSFGEVLRLSWVWIGVAAVCTGALLWSWHCMERLRSPEAFTSGNITPYLFTLYTILTMAGFIILGIFLLRTDVPTWVGWMLAGATALLAVLAVVMRDMPPFVYYVLAIILAITLLSFVKLV
jgi:hypothetical protein